MKQLSVFQKVTFLLVLAFGAMLLLGIMIYQTLESNLSRELRAEAQAKLDKSVVEIGSKIQVVETNLRETAVIAQGMNYMLYEQQPESVLPRKQLYNQLAVMMKVTPDMDILFVQNSSGKLYLSKYSQSLKISERIRFTEILNNGSFPESSDWGILPIEKNVFLTKTYTYGEYTLGTAINISHLEAAFQAHGDSAYYTISAPDGAVVYSGAGPKAHADRSVEKLLPIGSLGLTLDRKSVV